MRVQPARPSSPLTTTPTERRADASAAWSAAHRPAPPAPRTRTSTSTRSVNDSRREERREECPSCRRRPRLGPHGLADEPALTVDDEHRRRRAHPPRARHRPVLIEQDGELQTDLL